jgi:hypothetical protein
VGGHYPLGQSYRYGERGTQPAGCWPNAWGRVSFLTTPLSIAGWIDDPDHSLTSGMDVDVPHFDCLLIAPSITVEGLDHVILKPEAEAASWHNRRIR